MLLDFLKEIHDERDHHAPLNSLTSELPLFPLVVLISSIIITFLVYVFSILGSALASYMCGLLGSSNTPLSGLILMAILLVSFCLLMLLSTQPHFLGNADALLRAAGITILLGALIGCALAITSLSTVYSMRMKTRGNGKLIKQAQTPGMHWCHQIQRS